MGLWIFLVLFFVVSYWLAATPQKLVDRVGKILTRPSCSRSVL